MKTNSTGNISCAFLLFRLNRERYEVSFRIQSVCGKIRTRNYFVFGHFSRSEKILKIIGITSAVELTSSKVTEEIFAFRNSV